MRKSKYLILSGIYFNFDDDLTDIINVKKLFKNQNILDLSRFDKLKIIEKSVFSIDYDLNFIYLPKNIEIIDNFAFYKNQIQILDLSYCTKLKYIDENAFMSCDIKHLKLPKNIEAIGTESFQNNKIEILDLSNCINLNIIMGWAFESNQIKQLKLPQNINLINVEAFSFNKIKILDLSNCTQLKEIDENAFLNNPLNEIKILNEVEIEFNIDYKNDVWKKFIKYYHSHVEKAGDYKLENNEWQWYPL